MKREELSAAARHTRAYRQWQGITDEKTGLGQDFNSVAVFRQFVCMKLEEMQRRIEKLEERKSGKPLNANREERRAAEEAAFRK